MIYTFLSLCSLTLLFVTEDAQKTQTPKTDLQTYTNPVWTKDFPDPFVLEYRRKFYAYATETVGFPGIQVMESSDLVHWAHKGVAFTPPWATEHYWAPEVFAYKGQFFLTYSALNPQTKKHDIAIATGTSPLGPFTHRGILLRGDDNKVGAIDGTIFMDTDKTPYLIYSEEDPRSVILRRLSKDLLTTEGERHVLTQPDLPEEGGVNEAPTMIKRGDTYVLIYAGGGFQADNKARSNYTVRYATSKSLFEPFVKDRTPLIQSVPGEVYSPGHQCVIHLKSGEWWLLYHAFDNQKEPRYGSNPLGRTLRLDKLEWNGATPFMGSTSPSLSPRPLPKVRK